MTNGNARQLLNLNGKPIIEWRVRFGIWRPSLGRRNSCRSQQRLTSTSAHPGEDLDSTEWQAVNLKLKRSSPPEGRAIPQRREALKARVHCDWRLDQTNELIAFSDCGDWLRL